MCDVRFHCIQYLHTYPPMYVCMYIRTYVRRYICAYSTWQKRLTGYMGVHRLHVFLWCVYIRTYILMYLRRCSKIEESQEKCQ